MFRATIVAIILSVFLWPAAHACSPSPAAMLGHSDYEIYRDRLTPLLASDDAYIGVISTTTLREYSEEFNSPYVASGKTATRDMVELKIDSVETLRGTPRSFSDHYLRKAPVFSDADKRREDAYKSSDRGFGFWDQFALTTPIVDGYGSHTSCGFMSSSALEADSFYIVIKAPRSREYFEPVSGLNDPLIKDFRNIISGMPDSKNRLSPSDFFKHMAGYSEVTIKSCPAGKRERFPWDTSGSNLNGEDAFVINDRFNISPEAIKMIDLQVHNSDNNSHYKDTCKIGDQYLVIENDYFHRRRGEPQPFYMAQAKHRFLKITNGLVETSKVQSNIRITGQNLQTVYDVKNWIKSGQVKKNTP